MRKRKKPGDPFAKGDPVWVSLGGRFLSGFFSRKGAGAFYYVTVGAAKAAGWWVGLEDIHHRFDGDGINGEVRQADDTLANQTSDPLDPLS